ncbi:hypothetical protein [Arthrobacter roseus]|uniref:hypothetical protein n=1 Tax=Arthrobacter roseus TaxID=136274 RepID=UPI001EF789CB|nr:hypothetical protein [Arthrobacter roseus]MBM7848278.1 hypothetical protein [Arthrobacter roseus]
MPENNDRQRGQGRDVGKREYGTGKRDDAGKPKRSFSSRDGGGPSKGSDDRAPRRQEDRSSRPRRDDRAPTGRQYSERPSDGDRDRSERVHNPADLRSANRADRERSPEIDDDVTGDELDRATLRQVQTLETRNAEWVSKHLVMAGRLLDDEPEMAFEHALAASRRGGRLAAVREAVGLTAYAAGNYSEALRELRTFRRISGSNIHLPLMADCERGMDRPDRALEMARSEEATTLDASGQVEMAIVVSGARRDISQPEAALAALEIPQLDRNRAFSYSPRLFRAYSDVLAELGRTTEARDWERRAAMAEDALGIGAGAEPEILDLAGDEDTSRSPRR